MGTNRLEAFSDGVLAVAITLLVLDLHVDPDSEVGLAAQLRHQWPAFGAYGVSFFFIGVIWVNHHNLFRLAVRVDRRVMVYNLLLLSFVTAIPFTTATYAAYVLEGGHDARVAVLLYGVVTEGMAISFALIFAHIVRAGLTNCVLRPDRYRKLLLRYGLGSVMYPVITVIGLFNAPVMLVLYAGTIAYYFGPGLRVLEDGIADLSEPGTSGASRGAAPAPGSPPAAPA